MCLFIFKSVCLTLLFLNTVMFLLYMAYNNICLLLGHTSIVPKIIPIVKIKAGFMIVTTTLVMSAPVST